MVHLSRDFTTIVQYMEVSCEEEEKVLLKKKRMKK
jgi:hypothetical protein